MFDKDFSLIFLLNNYLSFFDSKNRFLKEQAHVYLGRVIAEASKIQENIFEDVSPLLKLILKYNELPKIVK